MQDITGVPTGGAQSVHIADEGMPHHYHFDNTSSNGDDANPNTNKISRWGPPLKSKGKGGADTKRSAKKAAKKTTSKGKKKFHCDTCGKDFCSTKALEQHKLLSIKHKKRQVRLEKQQRSVDNSFSHTNNAPSMLSPEQQHQKKSSDVSYYGHSDSVNWNEIHDEQFYHTNRHDRIAEANRQWSRTNSQVDEFGYSAPNTTGLQPDNCPSMNDVNHTQANAEHYDQGNAESEVIQSDVNQTRANAEHNVHGYDESEVIQPGVIQTQANAEHYDQDNIESDVKIGEENDGNSNNNHNPDVRKINGNLMKLTAEQSLQTRYPQGCQVIYSYEKHANGSDETRVRIGKIRDVYIDMMSSSRQLAYEINPNKSDTLVLIEENLLAFAPQQEILFHKTSRELSALAREEDEALEGIVLASQWINTKPFGSDMKLSYTILLQHSKTDEHILKTNVSGENISYRSTTSRLLSTKQSGEHTYRTS